MHAMYTYRISKEPKKEDLPDYHLNLTLIQLYISFKKIIYT